MALVMMAELVMNETLVVVEVAVSGQLESKQPVRVAVAPVIVPPIAPQTVSGIRLDSNVHPAAKTKKSEILDLVITPSKRTCRFFNNSDAPMPGK
jgi:hypothetical protein